MDFSIEHSVRVVVGCNVKSAHKWDEKKSRQMDNMLREKNNIVGIGETGFDLTSDISEELQEHVLTTHMRFAIDFDLPLICQFRGDDMIYRKGFKFLHNVRKKTYIIFCYPTYIIQIPIVILPERPPR